MTIAFFERAVLLKKRIPLNRPLPPKRVCGFTLLEILVAIFIFAIVISMIFGSFNMVFSSAEKLSHDADQLQMARTCLARMKIDLSDLYVALPPRYKVPEFDDKPEPYRVVGDQTALAGGDFGRLRFASLAHVPLGKGLAKGIAEIVYYVYAEKDQMVIKRADHLYPYPEFEENPEDPTLCEKVKALRFAFIDDEAESHEQWDSESDDVDYATPRSIAISLTIGDENESLSLTTTIEMPVYREKVDQSS